jgi:dihydroflavonol-4-reductase
MSREIVLTGASGFIAKHVLLKLLAAGHHVRATLRSPAREAEVRAAVLPHLPPEAAERLSFVTLDLLDDAGWRAALIDASALIHTASPFPIVQPKNSDDVIRPAVEGTRRALEAAQAAGVSRVVLTSSVIAILRRDTTAEQDEAHWADLDDPALTPYGRSKTLAERAAWEFAATAAPPMPLTVINPGFVLGPLLDGRHGSSVGLVARLLSGKDPMLPDMGLPVVDVRDVAEMHVRALETPATAGRRYLATAGSLTIPEMGRILKAAYPERRIATRAAPALMMRLMALFDPEVRESLPHLGRVPRVSNARARVEMGIDFIAAEDALRAAAASLVAHAAA